MSEFVFVDKPAGVTTHSSRNSPAAPESLVDMNDGYVEHLSARFETKLWVSHRLDRDTTGALCFARTKESAEALRQIFESRRIEKRYLFLTDRTLSQDQLGVESVIERGDETMISRAPRAGEDCNAFTSFEKLETSHGFSLWQAIPRTGRTHQIRLHAASVGIPILGDADYGGARFISLCLHSTSLAFDHDSRRYEHLCPEPVWFRKRELIGDHLLCRWLVATDRRERLLRSWAALGDSTGDEARTLRWIHSEGDRLRADQLGEVISLSWFSDSVPTTVERSSLDELIGEKNWTKWYLQVRGNRGRAPNEEQLIRGSEEFPDRWIASENGLRFEFRTDTGLSPGLFLDQRRNRLWVRDHSRAANVLNLFSYTGGFSVAAAAGGAAKVVSVDVSRPFMEWTKRNFELNDLPVSAHEFRTMDSREYLNWAAKKGLFFDLVICDPPSFSRSKSGPFQIERELDSLLEALVRVTKSEGRILFSLNFEGWTHENFARRLSEFCERTRLGRLETAPSADWDFELPGDDRNMKSALIHRF